MKMTKEQTRLCLRDIYLEWLVANQDCHEKELAFFACIRQRDDFYRFSFGRHSDYQMTAIWVREWDE
ncbi:TPA: hypothetical protein QHU17_001539 [Enterobacter hormaechei subsp. xiangfangensis]|nr:hypothetical protein [Enterobacter hormaechei subsp. xiangfangensis]